MWFRRDLRLADNPALCAAVASGCPVLPVYILDDADSGEWKLGAASRWWLHHSLCSLNSSLGGCLRVFSGRAVDVLSGLDAGAVYFNCCYEPWRSDDAVISTLSDRGISVFSFNGNYLFDPSVSVRVNGAPYKVFTAFYNAICLGSGTPRAPVDAPVDLPVFSSAAPVLGSSISSLGLLPSVPWYSGMADLWSPGEAGAFSRFSSFSASASVSSYSSGRDYPALPGVSRLSPHLAFGEISPAYLWHYVVSSSFLRELCWREFSCNLLYHFPGLPRDNYRPVFDSFPWRSDASDLSRWQRGETGFPIIDAGMRELWQTGYMHNRVRMLVGSFLVKNLLLHWHHGASWFWDTLLDADLANNSAGWQWVSGSGVDAAPYFRIFNPVVQGEKFDPDGAYVRKYVPELSALPSQYIHRPWDYTGASVSYPPPMVDLRKSRARALAAYRGLR